VTETLEAGTVIVGAGPAGIAAACGLGEAGEDVLIVDEGPRSGGQIWRHRPGSGPPKAAQAWLARLSATQVRVRHNLTVVDARPDGTLLGESEAGPVEIRGSRVILATGARELFLPFPGWTLPGVIGVGAAQALVKSGAELRNLEVVLAGSGPLLLPVASLLASQGARVGLIGEQAPLGEVLGFGAGLWRAPGKILEAMRYRSRSLGARYQTGVWAVAAHGDDRVREVVLTDGRRTWTRRCDLLCCSYGLVPNVELARWLGCEIDNGRVVTDEVQQTNQAGFFCVGETTGIGGAELSLVEGEIAAAHISGLAEALPPLEKRRALWRRFSKSLEKAFRPRRELAERVQPETTICRCEDVTCENLDPEWCIRQAKLYTRLGMGPCQGRVCGPAVHYLYGWASDSVRPPLKPCRLATLSER